MSTEKASMPRTLSGVVTSSKMDKSIVVKVERKVIHPRLGKFIKQSIKVHAHDPQNQCKEGDFVVVRECRPYSKTKKFILETLKTK